MRLFDIPPSREGQLDIRMRLSQGRLALLALIILIALGAVFYHLALPPHGFPSGRLIELPQDATVSEMGTILTREGAIRSPLAFKAYARLTFQDRDLASGLYVFDRPLGLALLVDRLADGEHGIAPLRITLTEGMTALDMARELARGIPGFDADEFLALASTSEGYLFPDTYFFMPTTKAGDAYARLRARFDERVATIASSIERFGRPLSDIVIMASLLEREAQTSEDKRIIAGILWKRLAGGMPLQVDAVFGYIREENGYIPTAADLALDSPYNTYRYTGLPPGPISNPGLDSLLAAIEPIESEYLYYLTGRDGNMYYGRTFDEHKENRARYLD